MPEKLGNTFKSSSLVSPLSADPGKADPGPSINNSPLMKMPDPLNLLNIPKAKKSQ